MDTRKAATEYRMAQWAQIMQTRVERGQSIQEYCDAEGLSRNTYFYWQKKLREAACTGLAKQETTVPTGIIPSGWTRVDPCVTQSEEKAITVEVGGCRVSVKAGADLELLTSVCRALKTLC